MNDTFLWWTVNTNVTIGFKAKFFPIFILWNIIRDDKFKEDDQETFEGRVKQKGKDVKSRPVVILMDLRSMLMMNLLTIISEVLYQEIADSKPFELKVMLVLNR